MNVKHYFNRGDKLHYYLNHNIKYLRKKSGMTQLELSEKLSISKGSLANIESGLKNTSIELLDKLRNLFNVSVDDLIYKDLSKEQK